MKKYYKSVLCALLIAILAAPGCQTKNTGETKNTSETTGNGGTAAAENTEVEASANTERVKLAILSQMGQGDFPEGSDENHNIFVDFLKEKTPYDFDFTFAADDAAENALIASGNKYDLIHIWNNTQYILNFQKEGYIAPLDDYLTDANYLKDPGQTPPELWNMCRIDEKTYAIPQAWVDCYYGLAMRVDWLQKLGLTPPGNLDEFKSALQAFRDKDPNGDGGNVIPLTEADGLYSMLELFRSIWGIHADYLAMDGKVQYAYATPQGKDMISYMADLYSNKLLDQEFATMTSEIVGQRLATGQVGAVYLPWWTMKTWDNTMKETLGVTESPFWWVPLPNGPDGKKATLRLAGPVDHFWVLPKTGHVKEGVDFINRILDPAVNETLCFGFENVHWKRDDAGKRYLTDEYNNIVWRWKYGDNLMFRMDFMAESENLEYGDWRLPIQQWGGDISTTCLIIPPVAGIEDAQANIGDYSGNELSKFIMGERPISEYDAYVSELKGLGLDDVLAGLQKAYDQTKGK